MLDTKALQTAHIGISIFEPAYNKYWFNYQADKYFVPGSNTKIPACYAAMKYLVDSLAGLRYDERPKRIVVQPNGDPIFLFPEFKYQPIIDFLKNTNKPIEADPACWQEEPLGSGWSWNNYQESYMAERSTMPVYRNLATISGTSNHWSFTLSIKGRLLMTQLKTRIIST